MRYILLIFLLTGCMEPSLRPDFNPYNTEIVTYEPIWIDIPDPPKVNRRMVKVTAYNPLESQTDSTPFEAAWGDRVREGIIAVSRDLEKEGLTRGVEVHVAGMGKYIVLDRMHYRKRNQIDIFMWKYKDAVTFGVQQREIEWRIHD